MPGPNAQHDNVSSDLMLVEGLRYASRIKPLASGSAVGVGDAGPLKTSVFDAIIGAEGIPCPELS